jgi:hypothetical protein
MDAVLHQRAGVFVKHQLRGFTGERTLHNLSECAEKHSE